MKTDAYTKVVLTGIAIFLGFIAFDYKPTINAQAGTSGGLDFCEVYTTHVNKVQYRWAAAITNRNMEYEKKTRSQNNILIYTSSSERDFEQLKHFIPVYTAYYK